MEQINYVENELLKGIDLPSFSAGDTVTVHYKIKEGGKERTQLFKGVVIQRKGKSTTETKTVSKISSGEGVERIFPLLSPALEKIEENNNIPQVEIFLDISPANALPMIMTPLINANSSNAFTPVSLSNDSIL